ncbi:MAG: D-glycero-beta-D-manno-heptose-7-phosphate kinase [Candidatus Krumholzibacteriota bacterium]|nr:D-glycero-beta-D-manno-heptose-7-phosphate kinase [Candidatus Krumholzibacteriota bacterium]
MTRSAVAVVGDLMLDRYLWGRVDRISPEAPVPVVAVDGTGSRPGGAANVAWNLVSLGIDARLVGVVGRDAAAREMRALIAERGIEPGFIIADGERVTTEKIRIVAHNQQVVRADFETGGEPGSRALGRLLAAIRRAIDGADAVVVSDYGKGVVTGPVMDAVREAAAARGVPILVDPKEGHFSLYRGAYVVTPNRKEAGGFYNRRIGTAAELDEVGRALLDDLEAAAILVTLGEDGMTLFERGERPRHFPTRASEVFDVTGAGDTVVGVLAAGLAAGAGLHRSIELANAAAGIVVREVGTATVGRAELERSFPA